VSDEKFALDPARKIEIKNHGAGPREKFWWCTVKGLSEFIAASMLRRAGFRDIANLIGGFDAWKAAGLPIHGPWRRRSLESSLPSQVPYIHRVSGRVYPPIPASIVFARCSTIAAARFRLTWRRTPA